MFFHEEHFFQRAFPKRDADAHKGDFGKVLIFAGSTGMAGAAILAGRAALRSGAGLVRYLLPSYDDPIYPILQTAVPEATCVTIDSVEDFNEYNAITAGSGLGHDLIRRLTLSRILKEYKNDLILDADALNMIASGEIPFETFMSCRAGILLTPHIGEAKRLLHSDKPIKTKAERLKAAETLSLQYRCIILLKGPGTIVRIPAGEPYINTTGNPGMATGGSGDVLSGIIAAFAAQEVDLPLAAECGAFIHGLAGDIAAKKIGEVCMNSSDIIRFLPEAWEEAFNL